MNYLVFLIILIITLIIIYIIFIIYVNNRLDNFKYKYSLDNIREIQTLPKKTKSFVINLDRNKDRLNKFITQYYASDLSIIPLQRFTAIDGKTVDLNKYVSEDAYKQILFSEKSGYRLRHYEMTKGAVGCFISHTALYNMLLKDHDVDYYIIFEDDTVIPKQIISLIHLYISNVPDDWDILLFGILRENVNTKINIYDKVDTWWGLFSYAINKKGALKFLNELDIIKKVDQQIDSMMSLMAKQGKLNVYSTSIYLFKQGYNKSDIQVPVKIQLNINPYKYKNIELYKN